MRKKQEMFALDPTLLLFFLIAFISEVIGAIAGFGSSTIFLPLALFFLDFKTALILVAISHLIGNIGRINFFRHGLDKKMIITFGIPSILLSFLGASLVGILPQSILQIILGIFLIAFSVLFLLKPSLKFAANTRTTITGGGISGFITGIVGTGGALRATFLTGFNLEKTKYIATAAVIALATDSTRIPLYLYQGFLLPQYYYYIPIFFVTAIGGSFLGRKIVGRINQTTFKKIVLLSIILVSIKFIIYGSSSILK
ncbi:MAG: sulfite exporter TauE/SafE family protein [Nitrososphaeraceae archaeon]